MDETLVYKERQNAVVNKRLKTRKDETALDMLPLRYHLLRYLPRLHILYNNHHVCVCKHLIRVPTLYFVNRQSSSSSICFLVLIIHKKTNYPDF